jgi:hypothetical protein
MSEPKILIVDIETKPLVSYTWGTREQNISLNQIKEDWSIIAWSAKWYKAKDGTVYGPTDKIYYQDARDSKDLENDKALITPLYKLLDEADIVVGQNSRSFDVKKLNARFLINRVNKGHPPSPFAQHDTKEIAFRHFGFTSAKLEYLSAKLCKKHQKLVKRKFEGQELWNECLKGNVKAWNEMRDYNKADVLATEELYTLFMPWGVTTNFNMYRGEDERCNCGSKNVQSKGFRTTQAGRYRRYRCHDCGASFRGTKNLSKPKNFKRRIV